MAAGIITGITVIMPIKAEKDASVDDAMQQGTYRQYDAQRSHGVFLVAACKDKHRNYNLGNVLDNKVSHTA